MSRRRSVLAALAIAVGIASSTWRPAVAQNTPWLTGQLLVATDVIRDPHFYRTVVLMLRHNARGAIGVIVNRRLGDAPVAKVLEALGRNGDGVAGSVSLRAGGPVERRLGVVLYTPTGAVPEDERVHEGLAFTRDPALLETILRGPGPRQWIFAFGHAGWAPGQLEIEITRGAWVSIPAEDALIFDEDLASKWQRAMNRRRIVL